MIPLHSRGDVLWALADRSLFWERARTLIVADWRLGSAGSIGRLEDEAALKDMGARLARTGAERLVLLGSPFGAGLEGEGPASFRSWRAGRAERVVAVLGDDFDAAAPACAAAGVDAAVHLAEPPFDLCRDALARSRESLYRIGGRLRPAIWVRGPGAARVRTPCFWFGPALAALPAFGGATTGTVIRPKAADAVIAAREEGVSVLQRGSLETALAIDAANAPFISKPADEAP